MLRNRKDLSVSTTFNIIVNKTDEGGNSWHESPTGYLYSCDILIND